MEGWLNFEHHGRVFRPDEGILKYHSQLSKGNAIVLSPDGKGYELIILNVGKCGIELMNPGWIHIMWEI